VPPLAAARARVAATYSGAPLATLQANTTMWRCASCGAHNLKTPYREQGNFLLSGWSDGQSISAPDIRTDKQCHLCRAVVGKK
jgi:hypothetical protein